VLAGIMLGALLPRVIRLDRLGLWYDEGFSVLMVEFANPLIWRADVHPPLYYGLLWAWSKVASGDTWLRALSALLGVATIPVVYALGVRLFSRAAGLWAAAFLGVLYLHVWYSREARMYALMVLLFSLALLGLVMALRRERGGWAVYTSAMAGLALSQGLGIVYTLLLAGTYWILAADPVGSRLWRKWAGATALALLPFAIWLPFYLSRIGWITEGFWITLNSPWPPLVETLRGFAVSPIPQPSKALVPWLGLPGRWLGRLIWAVPIIGALAVVALGHRRTSRRSLLVLLALYAAPIIGLTIVSLLFRPILIPRVLLPVCIPMVLALGALVDTFPPRRRLHHAVALILAAVLALASFYGLRYVRAPHQEWREASRFLQNSVNPGDTLFFSIGSGRRVDDPNARFNVDALTLRLLIRRYDPEARLSMVPQLTLREAANQCDGDHGDCLERSVGHLAPGRVIWMVRAYDRSLPSIREWLDRHLEITATYTFEGVVVERRMMRAR
jgi:4-amino-4-deoxy-L-arabinose transferase-like glycosyltransferase